MNTQPRVQTVTCPCCGGYLGELPDPDKVRSCLSPSERRVFDVLMKAGAEGMIKLDLSIALYGEREGGSDRAIRYTSIMVSRVRNKIDRFGYFIGRNSAPHRGVYRIIPAEVSA